MIAEIQKRIKEASGFITNDPKELEKFRIEYLGKKGYISSYFAQFKKVNVSEKKEYGLAINELKKVTLQKLEDLKKSLNTKKNSKTVNKDLTRPALMLELGSRHPISIIRDKIIDIFYKIGFNISSNFI